MPLHWARAPNACMHWAHACMHWAHAPKEDFCMHVGSSMKSRCTMHLCRGCAICGAYLRSVACPHVGNVCGERIRINRNVGGMVGGTRLRSRGRPVSPCDSPACVGNVFGTNVGNVCGGHTGSTAYASNSRMNWLMGTCKGKCNRTVVQTWGHFQRQVRVPRPLTTQAVSLPNLLVVCSVGSEFPRVVLGC